MFLMVVLQLPATARPFLPCQSLLLLKKEMLHSGRSSLPEPFMQVMVSHHPLTTCNHPALKAGGREGMSTQRALPSGTSHI